MKKYTKKVAVHAGMFHSDDVLAVAILSIIFDVDIIRSNKPEEYQLADIVADVGREYDDQKYFDHHQDLDEIMYWFNPKNHDERIKPAAAGLIFKRFGKIMIFRIMAGECYNPSMFMYIEDKLRDELIIGADAHDNYGADLNTNRMSVMTAIRCLNSPNVFDAEAQMRQFKIGVNFYVEMLTAMVKKYADDYRNQAIVRQAIIEARASNSAVLILPRGGLPVTDFLSEYPNAKLMAYPGRNEGEWNVSSIRQPDGTQWLFPEDFPDAVGRVIAGAELKFCHSARFIAAFKCTAAQIEKLVAELL